LGFAGGGPFLGFRLADQTEGEGGEDPLGEGLLRLLGAGASSIAVSAAGLVPLARLISLTVAAAAARTIAAVAAMSLILGLVFHRWWKSLVGDLPGGGSMGWGRSLLRPVPLEGGGGPTPRRGGSKERLGVPRGI